MLRLRANVRRVLVVSALLLLGPLAASASAAISFGAVPIDNNTYFNLISTVPVSYSITEVPAANSVRMTWTYVSGPATVSAPVVMQLASSASSGSFVVTPSTLASNSAISLLTSTSLPDGTWTVQMSYIRTVGTTVVSPTRTITLKTATIPPVITAPLGGSTGSTVPVAFTLPSLPAGPPTLTLTNTSTSTVSVLTLGSDSQSQTFTLDPSALADSVFVASVTGANALTDGPYSATLSYQDVYGHPVASATQTGFVLDQVTTPPTLISPTSGTVQTRPVRLVYSLPEAPLPGSVAAIFTGPITLTQPLPDTAAGTQTFLLNPTTTAALPTGTYAVSLRYRDALGNPTATTINTGVFLSLDAAPPVITTPISGATANGTLPVSFTLPSPVLAGSASLDLTGPSTLHLDLPQSVMGATTASLPTCALTPGAYTLTVRYTDLAGDPEASASVGNVQVAACSDGTPTTPTPTADPPSTPTQTPSSAPAPSSTPAPSATPPPTTKPLAVPKVRWRVTKDRKVVKVRATFATVPQAGGYRLRATAGPWTLVTRCTVKAAHVRCVASYPRRLSPGGRLSWRSSVLVLDRRGQTLVVVPQPTSAKT